MVKTRARRKVEPTTPDSTHKKITNTKEPSPNKPENPDNEMDTEETVLFVIDKTKNVKSTTPDNSPEKITKERSHKHPENPDNEMDTGETVQFVIDKTPSRPAESENDSESEESALEESTESESEAEEPVISRKKGIELSSSLQPGTAVLDTYLNTNAYTKPLSRNNKIDRLLSNKGAEEKLMKKSIVNAALEKKDRVPVQESVRREKKQRQMERSMSKGKGWFDMKAQELSDEKKNEMLVLQMRRALDPKRFYKAPDIRGIQKFFQMGKVVDGPGEFYNRIPKKQQKQSLVDELLADVEFKKYSKRKLAELQESKHKWKGAHKHMKRLKKKKK